jgi:hypothetical protein
MWGGLHDGAGLPIDGVLCEQGRGPLLSLVADHIARGQIRPHETVYLIGGYQPHLLARRERDPDIVVVGGMVDQQRGGARDSGQREEADQPQSVAASALEI